ncbi:MAG: hypothetical protein KDE14_01290 [Rhodobacteraceae bacterium]|nr:hypothetical protein [Paracoccaceae bacterium]
MSLNSTRTAVVVILLAAATLCSAAFVSSKIAMEVALASATHVHPVTLSMTAGPAVELVFDAAMAALLDGGLR